MWGVQNMKSSFNQGNKTIAEANGWIQNNWSAPEDEALLWSRLKHWGLDKTQESSRLCHVCFKQSATHNVFSRLKAIDFFFLSLRVYYNVTGCWHTGWFWKKMKNHLRRCSTLTDCFTADWSWKTSICWITITTKHSEISWHPSTCYVSHLLLASAKQRQWRWCRDDRI